MKTLAIKAGVLAALVLFAVTGGAVAHAGMVEGTVQGFACLINDKVCPVDRLDPHVGIEKSFVIVDKSGAYYFVPNMDRSILARNILRKVRATGKVSSKYKAIMAESFHVFNKGQWQEVWSLEMERKEAAAYQMGT